MKQKQISKTMALLYIIYLSADHLSKVLSRRSMYNQINYGSDFVSYKATAEHLKRAKLVTTVTKQGQKFLKLTKKGELKILLDKSVMPTAQPWDGKWRMILFDIPKSSNPLRDKFRRLLRKASFVKFQGSVYISPYPLNREAVRYLKEIGLMDFIRIIKVEELDDDKSLKKKFGLK